MDKQEIHSILAELNFPCAVTAITQLCREEDGSSYDVWKIETAGDTVVLKKIAPEEKKTCKASFPNRGCGTPKIYGFAERNGDTYMLMEFFEGETMSHSTRGKITLALDALIQMQEKFWSNIRREVDERKNDSVAQC